MPIELALPQRDIDRLQHFARRELPKATTTAGVIDHATAGRASNTALSKEYIPGRDGFEHPGPPTGRSTC